MSHRGAHNQYVLTYGVCDDTTAVAIKADTSGNLSIVGNVEVSNFPAPITSVAVNNLEPIELKLDDINGYLQNLSVVVNNTINYLPQQETIIVTPTTTFAGAVVIGSQFNLLSVLDGDVRYNNAIFLGSVDASINTTPKLVFQYSDDDTNWFSDGVSCSFYKPSDSTTWEFAFQRAGLGVKSVRLVAENTTTINYLSVNLSVDNKSKLVTSASGDSMILDQSTSGVAIYGSSNGTDKVLLKTTADGKLETTASGDLPKMMLAKDYDADVAREVACDASGNLKINVSIDDLTPSDDGVLTYGSYDGTTPLVIKTDASGSLDVVGSVAVNNLEPIELKLDDNNVYLQGISVITSGIRNILNYPSRQETIISNFVVISAGEVIGGTEFALESVGDSEVKYKSVLFVGRVDASINTDPKIIFQYSTDDTNFFSDGGSASFYKPAGSTSWEFAFQRSGLGVKSVRLVAETTTTIDFLSVNLSVDDGTIPAQASSGGSGGEVILDQITSGVAIYGSTDGTDRVLLKTTADGKLETTASVSTSPSTPATDGIAVYGSSNGTNKIILKTTADGTLATTASVSTSPSTPATDGIAVYGSSNNGTDRVLLKTTADGKLETNDYALKYLQLNVSGKAVYTNTILNGYWNVGAGFFTEYYYIPINDNYYYLDTLGQPTRPNVLTWFGYLDLSYEPDPQIVALLSGGDYYSNNFYTDGEVFKITQVNGFTGNYNMGAFRHTIRNFTSDSIGLWAKNAFAIRILAYELSYE